MSNEERVKATAKEMEGKLQETAGKASDNPKDEGAGKVKQAEGKGRHALQDLKDRADRALD